MTKSTKKDILFNYGSLFILLISVVQLVIMRLQNKQKGLRLKNLDQPQKLMDKVKVYFKFQIQISCKKGIYELESKPQLWKNKIRIE
ncbi:unnamed protein product (macronuclear) [Paramecium tetraurelia]|uniref:Transmembrane protein n=1 Tax=Paramecium tetraurelia TaxID=5888 RepID=A0BUQ0_PARTE|nr:uncharacterized protein GSPATT00005513001 [Paramecium tetraurelia]CAK62267.1 unnamed protein product [Paramecium tetraurelia]|eukprot:XP_001429665.1 hypothetical protein (macronuclear) [Paramecium tetraurelia strain d4-2]